MTIEERAVENIRLLCAEMSANAEEYDPGSALGLSHFMHILFTEYLVLDPLNPGNLSRDILILSNGHASAALYALQFLLGYLSIDDIKAFSSLGGRTPGCPIRNLAGIEISTGPAGQGVAAAVGFAASLHLLRKHCGGAGPSPRVYCIFGDRSYQEGISQEAFSLCSKLGINNITFIYDYNEMTVDGCTALSMNEDVAKRLGGLAFTIIEADGTDPVSIRAAMNITSSSSKIILLHTRVEHNSLIKDRSAEHKITISTEDILQMKRRCGVPEDVPFGISEDLRKAYERARSRMAESIAGRMPFKINLQPATAPYYASGYVSEELATVMHFENALNDVVPQAPLLTGCADLTPLVRSRRRNAQDFGNERSLEAYFRFGRREHAMCGACNGIAAHGVFIPVCGTILNFVSYGIPAIRLAVIDNLRVIYALSHDSIFTGAGGPTYQPVEMLAVIRAIPNLIDFRPCDGRETRAALLLALRSGRPCAIVLTRQAVPEIPGTVKNVLPSEGGRAGSCTAGVERGAYPLVEVEEPDVILLASGAEVELAYKVKSELKEFSVSVVSFVSFELFEQQDEEYKRAVLREGVLKVSIEALSTFGWHKYADMAIGIDHFGVWKADSQSHDFLGFTVQEISKKVRGRLSARLLQDFVMDSTLH